MSYPYHPPGPAPRRGVPAWVWIVVGVVILCGLLSALGAVLALANNDDDEPGPAPAPASSPYTGGSGTITTDKEAAESECYAAFRREFESRQKRAKDENPGATVISTITDIEILDSRAEATGYQVNGTVHYSLTTQDVDPINDTVELTCFALNTAQGMTATVKNRK